MVRPTFYEIWDTLRQESKAVEWYKEKNGLAKKSATPSWRMPVVARLHVARPGVVCNNFQGYGKYYMNLIIPSQYYPPWYGVEEVFEVDNTITV